ncbi:MAG: histidine kinase dimerization/phospho-acceptor domain-containing protein [Gemmatimonadales bacterium]
MHETSAVFAHEIGTPLNTVSCHLQLLRDDFGAQGDARGVDRVRLLRAQVDRVAGIVHELSTDSLRRWKDRYGPALIGVASLGGTGADSERDGSAAGR